MLLIRSNKTSLPSARTLVRPPRRPKTKINVFTRIKLVELRKTAGQSFKDIYAQYPWILISIIKTTVYRADKRVDIKSLPRSSAPRKLNEDDKAKINAAINNNPRILYDDLLASVDNKVKRASIQWLIAKEGRRKWLILNRLALEPEHAATRLRQAYEYESFTPKDQARVFQSDECTVKSKIGERREQTFTPKVSQITKRDIRSLPIKDKQKKQMFQASFSGSTRRTRLIPLFGDPNSARRGFNRFIICDLYARILPTLLANRDGIF